MLHHLQFYRFCAVRVCGNFDYALPVPQPLPRFLDRELMIREQAATLARVLLETAEEAPKVSPSARGGDWQRMRGLPCVGPGIGGTSPGTDPLRALLAKERRRRR